MQRINLLDLGRFLASISVLFFHYFYNGIKDGGKVTSIDVTEPISSIAKYGHIGVPFFFMISGYVIFYSALNKSAYQFFVSRMKRLYPAYWIAVILTTLVAFMIGRDTVMAVTIKQAILNLTMLHNYIGVKNVDGVYWTLFLELRFYMIVFFIMFFFNERVLLGFFKIWPVIILGSVLSGKLGYFIGSQYSYFTFGVLIAMFHREKSTTTIAALALSVALCFYDMNKLAEATTDYIVYSTFGLIFMAFFASLNIKSVQNFKVPGSYLLGALTYPLYLVHAHIGYMVLQKFATNENKGVVYALLIPGVLLISYFIHIVVEKGMKATWDFFFPKVLYPIYLLENTYRNRK